MQKIKALIPNAFTLANLFFGILGIFHAFDRNWDGVIMMLSFSLIMDVFDGLAARVLGVAGDLGKQLDSLADVVSFGVLPSIVLFFLVREQCEPLSIYQQFFPLACLILAMATAYRLGKFNIDTRQSDYFFGLPSPAQAIASVGLAFWANEISTFFRDLGINPAAFYLSFVAIMSIAMLSELRLPAFKSWKYPSARPVLGLTIILGLALFIYFYVESGNNFREGLKSLSPALLLYLLFGALIFRPKTPVQTA
ncbi:MAG: CDP-diacylglycerol--serine O-phosphatidyltransferase [Flavobacteriales bacterium]|nr:MAG: CDP-diacylglycerol--serine O-phosphatidyltransferase [Flavobacteriales bacterium]